MRAAALAGELTEAARTTLPNQLPAAPQENRMANLVYNPAAPRSARRRASRIRAREQADAYFAFVDLAPRDEPARDDTCGQHHRKLPCKRCAEAGAE